jgi:carboxyl-terminal processing protease
VKKSSAPNPGGGGWRLARRFLVIVLALALAGYFALPVLADKAQSYESLRLFTEALFEISQKYVWPKSEEDMIYGALRGMMNSLDADSSFLTPKEYQNYQQGKQENQAEAGLEPIFKDNLLTVACTIDNGPAARAGIKPGDHILKIDGQLVRNLTTQEVVRRFTGAPGTQVKVQVLRNGMVKPLDLTLTLEPLGPSTVTSQFLEDNMAYIRMRAFNDETPEELASALRSIKKHRPPVRGLILDLRNNARGTLEQAVRTAAVMLGDEDIVIAKGRTPNAEETFKGKARSLVFKPRLPLAVLVDQGTARAAEILAGALRDQSQATLLGAKTLGLCGITKAIPLQDGSALVMTVAQCYTPHGQKIQGKGLEPEIQGKTPKGKEKTTAKILSPDQDPWVRQAVDLLKFGKPHQVALKDEPK